MKKFIVISLCLFISGCCFNPKHRNIDILAAQLEAESNKNYALAERATTAGEKLLKKLAACEEKLSIKK